MLASPLFAKAADRVLEQKRGGWRGSAVPAGVGSPRRGEYAPVFN